jgi:3-deoxy-manno-octulosonate cytidylyltransferase (CMP-KDO synthetase)
MLDEVYIATCDKEIMDYAVRIGAESIMTKDNHQRASDRTAEAALKIERLIKKRLDIVVMIQGDEPMLFPEMIDLAVEPILKDKNIEVANLMAPLASIEEFNDPNEIKVVVDRKNFALYFSREPIPSLKKNFSEVPMYKQVCIIPFRRDFLIKFTEFVPTILEKVESIDMLRILENGYKVKMILTNYMTHSVDTIEDLRYVETLMGRDSLLSLYKINSQVKHEG